jgi:hypothetical protein
MEVTPEQRARLAWFTWSGSQAEASGFSREVARYLDAEDDGLIHEVAEAIRNAITYERSACAMLVADWPPDPLHPVTSKTRDREMADAIRART